MNPSDLDVDKVEAALRAGAGFERAMGLLGISRSTIYRWKAQGLRDLEENLDTPLARLARTAEIERAKLIAKAENVAHRAVEAPPVLCAQCGQDATAANPQRALAEKDRMHHVRWILSKLAREDYGDEIAIKVRGALESVLDDVEPHMSRPAYAELVAALAAVAGLDSREAPEDHGADVDDDPLPLH